MSNKSREKDKNAILEELVLIKRLLVLLLIKEGVPQDEIGAALKVFRTTVGRMFQGQKIEPFSETN